MSEYLYAPEVIREFLEITSQELFLHAGFEAIAGHPLPDGRLPVAAANLGMVLVSGPAWEAYRSLCESERLAQPA